MNWLKGFQCRRRGHVIVSVIEEIAGRLEHTADYCERCGRRTRTYKGGLLQAYYDAYRNYPGEFTNLFEELSE